MSGRRLEEAIEDLDPRDLAGKVLRSESIKLRVTPDLKARIRADAERWGLSMTDLLLSIYAHASPKLKRRR